MFSENERLKKQISDMLFERSAFNKMWTKMNMKLSRNKWYLLDMLEYSMIESNTYVEICKILQNTNQKFDKYEYKMMMSLSNDYGNDEIVGIDHPDLRDENEKRKINIDNILRRIKVDKETHEFMRTKTRALETQNLEPLKYFQRRETDKELYRNLCKKFTEMMEDFKKEEIENYNQEEYFRYSNYKNINNIDHQILNLKTYIDDLYDQIRTVKNITTNKRIITPDEKYVERIKLLYDQIREKNSISTKTQQELSDRMKRMFKIIFNLFQKTKSNELQQHFKLLLGDNSKTTIFNFRKYLEFLEKRLNFVMYCIFASKHQKMEPILVNKPTDLNEILNIHQQCPECAERDYVIQEFGSMQLLTMDEIRQKFYKDFHLLNIKAKLHTISQCNIPRSRTIRPKRYFLQK